MKNCFSIVVGQRGVGKTTAMIQNILASYDNDIFTKKALYIQADHFLLTLEQNIHTTLESDLIAIYPSLSGNSIKKIKELLSIIAASVPFTPDLKRLKRILDVGDERTLKAYIKYLEDAGIILTVSKSGRGLRELEKPEKIYLNNPNLIYAISSHTPVNIGNLREPFGRYLA